MSVADATAATTNGIDMKEQEAIPEQQEAVASSAIVEKMQNCDEEDIQAGKDTDTKDISMEELKYDEEKEEETKPKDTSADFLGQQSLLMSDSDDEVAEKEIHVDSRRKTQRIVDSDDEDEEKKLTEEKENQKDDEQLEDVKKNSSVVSQKSRKKISALIDSDSEAENTPEDAASDVELEDSTKTAAAVTTKKRNQPIDTDSEPEGDSEEASRIKQSTENDIKKKTTKMSTLIDSESESDSGQSNDDADENASRATDDEAGTHAEVEPQGKNEKKLIRASAKKAMDEMQSIQSEQQRLHREANISIPYHKPKRHTLQEFLKRHAVTKTQMSPGGNASPKMQSKSLKMTPEELVLYAKLMEKRAKEATEFFKSDSENEDELKPNAGIKDIETSMNALETAVTADKTEHQIDALEVQENNVITVSAMDADNIENSPLVAALPEDALPSTSKGLIITEVIELPKVNVNAVLTADNVKRLIHSKQLPESPTLKFDANMLIDLETGDLVAKAPTGVDNLLQRFLKAKGHRKPKKTETLSILSTENGKVEMSKVNISISEDKETVEQKPGAAYFKLKENLRSIICEKRRAELEKKKQEKLEEELEQRKCFDDEDEEDEDIEYDPETKPKKASYLDTMAIDDEENALNENEEGEEEEEIEEDEECDEEADNELDQKALNKDDNTAANNDEDDAEAEDENDDDDEDDDDDDEDTETAEDGKRKNRIITAFQDDSDEEIDYLRTPKTQPNIRITAEKLYDNEETALDDEAELLGLCSGQFGETQQTSASAIISQMPITQAPLSADAANDELLELCSGKFDDKAENVTQFAAKSNKIMSSDEENVAAAADSALEATTQRTKKLTKKQKKKKPKLGFSDDEDDEITNVAASEVDEEEQQNTDEEPCAEELPETCIEYDSEENEIVVQMTKTERVKQAQTFFEKEAELSESEWGSADEDEKNMDKYDIELGDEENFDREKIRSELGQIHARKMLDEDIREVRKIQQMFVEDEEQDGVARQRQFKWKNAESGFSLDAAANGEPHEDNGDSADEENEQLWRKIRYEREQLLKEQGLKENSQDFTINSTINTTLSSTILGNTTNTTGPVKKLNIITAKKTLSVEVKKSSPFLISKTMSSTANKKPVRGSFLVRDKETLSKIVGLTKGGAVDVSGGAAGPVSLKISKPQNFVFATLTEEEHANLKRKADDLLNSSAENGINFMKKPKLEPRRDKCLIDQLL